MIHSYWSTKERYNNSSIELDILRNVAPNRFRKSKIDLPAASAYLNTYKMITIWKELHSTYIWWRTRERTRVFGFDCAIRGLCCLQILYCESPSNEPHWRWFLVQENHRLDRPFLTPLRSKWLILLKKNITRLPTIFWYIENRACLSPNKRTTISLSFIGTICQTKIIVNHFLVYSKPGCLLS